jgi:hypothetical protein
MNNENQSNRIIAKGIKMPNGDTFWETDDGKKYTKDDHYFIGDNENYGECRSVTMIGWHDWNRPYEYLAGKYGEGWMFHRSTDSGVTLLGRVCIPAQPSPAVAVPDYKEEVFQLRQKAENWSTKLEFIAKAINSRKISLSDKEREFPHLLIERLHTDSELLKQRSESPRITEQDAREIAILNAINSIESSHFRTVHDHGATEHAQIVLGHLRSMIGLPMVFKKDLPVWDGKKYAMPADSNLIANKPALLNKLNAKPEGGALTQTLQPIPSSQCDHKTTVCMHCQKPESVGG